MTSEGGAHGGIGRRAGDQRRRRLLDDHAAGRSKLAHDGISRTGCYRRNHTRRLAPRGLWPGSLDDRLRRREGALGVAVFLTLPRVGQGPGQRNAFRSGAMDALRHHAGDDRGIEVSDDALGMLRHMRKQALGSAAPYGEVRAAAISVGLDPGGGECRVLVDELLRAGYIRRYPSPSLTANGLYRLTDSGIVAADEAVLEEARRRRRLN